MIDLLMDLGFDIEETNNLLMDIDNLKLFNKIKIFNRYNVARNLVKHIINERKDIIIMDDDRLEYILESIISNGDLIEDILLEII